MRSLWNTFLLTTLTAAGATATVSGVAAYKEARREAEGKRQEQRLLNEFDQRRQEIRAVHRRLVSDGQSNGASAVGAAVRR